MTRVRLLPFMAVGVMVACQGDQPSGPRPPGITAAISDGGHGGNRHFFFLPPMVPPPGEDQPPPFSGVFDATLAPVVQICVLGTNGNCAPLVSFPFGGPFNPSQPLSAFTSVHLAALAQTYFVVWRPDWLHLDPTRIFRVSVLVNSQTLGVADVQVVTSLTQFAAVWAGKQFVPLIKGGPLAVIFRIEQGALQAQCPGQPDCVQQTIGPNPTTTVDVVTPSGQAAVSFPPGYFTQAVTLTVFQVLQGCFAGTNPPTPYRAFGCYNFSTSSGQTNPLSCNEGSPDPTKCARVEICPTLTSSDARYSHLELRRSDVGKATKPVGAVASRLIQCGPTIGLGAGGGANVAHTRWHRFVKALASLVRPQPLFAATAMIHGGLGGLTCCFSNFGWALPLRLSTVSGTSGNSATVTTTVSPAPQLLVEYLHPSPMPAPQWPVKFSVVSGSGSVSAAAVSTDANGHASVSWSLGPAAGLNLLVATTDSAVGSPDTLTATGTPIGSWTATGSIGTGRRDHTATLLSTGKVLIVGGTATGALLYDPSAGTFAATGTPQYSHGQGSTATVLGNGTVFIVGGTGAPMNAELYDPSTGTFTAIENQTLASREFHTATLLSNGRVLLAGGESDATGGTQTHNAAEIYDPVTNAFTLTGSLNAARDGHAATLLPDGRVFVVGGTQTTTPGNGICLASGETFDPATGTFSLTAGTMATTRCGPNAVMLGRSGRVLVIGWLTASAELFDPTSGSFTSTGSMALPHGAGTATLLGDGRVLIAGGFTATGPLTTSQAEIYDPSLAVFLPASAMTTPRQEHTATLLPDGRVVVVGGFSPTSDLSSAELFSLPLSP
jgi:galactose oxidase-like protein